MGLKDQSKTYGNFFDKMSGAQRASPTPSPTPEQSNGWAALANALWGSGQEPAQAAPTPPVGYRDPYQNAASVLSGQGPIPKK